MNGVYLAVSGRIRREVQELVWVADRTMRIWHQATSSPEDYHVDAVALNLHGFYAGVERIFEMIADRVDGAKPVNANWHQELLHQMIAEIPSIRPAVLSPGLRDSLDRYRGFRHVVRNVYTFRLDRSQIEPLVNQLQAAMNRVEEELLAFATFLEQVATQSEL